jgi:hypothetical protein
MPCRVEGVGSGAHLVRLTVREAPKATTPHLTPDQLPEAEDKPEPVVVEDRSSRSRSKAREDEKPKLSALLAATDAKPAQPAPAAEPAPPSTTSATESSSTRGNSSNTAVSPSTAAAASIPAAPLGTIHVSSNIPANVVVDGKVLGRAPRSIRVSSGVHTVVVAGPKGRKVQTVRIDKGRTRKVSARF